MTSRTPFSGPAVLSYGFRPFFLAATFFAAVVIPVWLMVWQGKMDIEGPFAPVDWHVHEMIFGYAAAVIAGFLFTAVPNWTGRMPTRGWPLAALILIWLAGRLSVAGVLGLAPAAAALVDCAFLLAITAMFAMEIVAGRNWRNLKVVVPLMLLFSANVVFHVEAMTAGTSQIGRRLGLGVVLFLILLIGGRIIPSFTRNWLAQRRATRMPVPFGHFDAAALAAGAVGLVAWTVAPVGVFSGGILGLAGLVHLIRLSRWRGIATWRSPLLMMLHIAYAFIPLGLFATAAAALGLAGPAAGLHLLGIGAVGSMTIAVMVRATRGHTGRSLAAGAVLSAGFSLVVLAALVRAILPSAEVAGLDGIALAGALWTAGFSLIAGRLAPMLLRPNVARRRAGLASRA